MTNQPETSTSLGRRRFLTQSMLAASSIGAGGWAATKTLAAGTPPEVACTRPFPPTDQPQGTEPRQKTLRVGLVSAASYGRPVSDRKSGSNHGSAFATLFNGWNEEAAGRVSGTFIKSASRIPGVRVTKIWDPLPEAARAFATACEIEQVTDTPEACAEDVDAVLLIDDGSGEQWRYALHPLKNGVPVFCDKPLAMTGKDARRLAELARQSQAKLMSASSLRFVPDIVGLSESIKEIGKPELVTATGPGELVYYGIHALSMVYSVVGGGIQQARYVGSAGRHCVHYRYDTGLQTHLYVTEPDQFPMPFQIQVYGSQGMRTLTPKLDDLYRYLLEAFVQYVRTGVEPYPIEQEVELIAALEAAERSMTTGKPVEIKSVLS